MAEKIPLDKIPSREALFDSLRLQRYGKAVVIGFTHGNMGKRYNLRVTGVHSDDDDGDKWVVNGYESDDLLKREMTFWINTRLRTGWTQL